jgi:pilus assembly protein CpaB
MKWTIVGLFALGVIAAVAAAILVARFSAAGDTEIDSPDNPIPDVPVVVATKQLEPMTIITPDAVTIATKKRSILPQGSFTDTSQVLSKVLKFPAQQGKMLTEADFYNKGSPAELAAALKDGERCVNVALNDSMGLETLLYPGSLVDVMCSMHLRGTDEDNTEQPISITLIENVRVLAVGRETIVHQTDVPAEDAQARAGRPTVALAVTTDQAEKLKLAMQEGSVSLSLRNPRDTVEVPVRVTGMASLSPLLGARASGDDAVEVVGAKNTEHRVVILRGGQSEVRSFESTSAPR